MRQRLFLTLAVLFAVALLFGGCSSTNRSAMQRSLYVDQHPEISEQVADAILNGQIMVGMSQEMVQVAWGKPVRMEAVTAGNEDVAQHWIYGNYFVGGTITNLYFDSDNVLVRCEVKNQSTGPNTGPSVAETAGDRIKATPEGGLVKSSAGNH